MIDRNCSKLGYGVSWLARTYNRMPEQVHMLNVQYRMDKTILDFPNKRFYRNQIMSGDNVVGREPFVAHPVLFVDTQRRGREEKNQYSWINHYGKLNIIAYLPFAHIFTKILSITDLQKPWSSNHCCIVMKTS